MRVVYGLDQLDPPPHGCVLTVGNFDGVHRAHQQLIAQAGLFAADTGGPVVVLTFEPHPLTVVAPDKAPTRLAPLDEKLRCLARAGAHLTVVARSDPALLGLEPETFIEKVIRDRFLPTHMVEGPSFGFGRGRRGTPEMLREAAARFDCKVHIVDPVMLRIEEGETLMVSSSLIRRLIADGDVRRAALCLSRPYALFGIVEKGQGRGRTLGFPTANLGRIEQLIPAEGVYAGRAEVTGRVHLCAISIGRTPTFDGQRQLVEVHLLDMKEDLYDQALRLEFDTRLRSQLKFDTPEALVEQLRRDVQAVRDGQAAGSTTVGEG